MLALALAALLSIPTASTTDEARALDMGKTLLRVEALRAQADYDDAAAELRGWIERWNTSAVGVDEMERMRELMRKMVELEELFARARQDEDSARAFLRHVVTFAEPTSKTAEQAIALKVLARHDTDVMDLLNATFPAHVTIAVDADLVEDPNLLAFPLESALVEVSRNALPIVRGPGASELRVHVTMRENDRSKSHVLHGTSMKSYAVHMSAEIVAPDGEALVKAATTTSVLGINPGFGAKTGVQRCAQALYQQLVDDLAKRAAL